MSSRIDDFELSVASNAVEGTTETIDSISSTQNRKISPIHEHCRTPTPEEKQEKPESKWIWCKYCPKYSAQNTINIRLHLDNAYRIIVSKIPNSGICTTTTKTIEALYTKLLL